MPQTAKKPPRRPRIEEVDPDRAAAMIIDRQAGMPYAKLAQKHEAGVDRVKDILTRNPDAFGFAKTALSRACLVRAEQYANAVTDEKVEKMTGLQLVIASKIASQQAIELLAKPSITASVNLSVVQDLDRAISDLRNAKAIPAPVVDLPSPDPDPAKGKV